MVATLKELARCGRALELGVGTGRVALPLAQAGVRVDGIDASPKMLAKLQAKPGAGQVSVTLGNFADIPRAGKTHHDALHVGWIPAPGLGQRYRKACTRKSEDEPDQECRLVIGQPENPGDRQSRDYNELRDDPRVLCADTINQQSKQDSQDRSRQNRHRDH